MRFWAKVEPLVPVVTRPEGRQYRRKAGAGRPPMPARQVFSAIVYVLRTGCQWKALPREFGSASAIHAHFMRCQRSGFFLRVWRAGLAEYDEMERIAWRWQSIDGAMHKAPLAQQCVGPTPRTGGKNGRKRSLLLDARGVQLSLVASGANVHDVKLLEATLQRIVYPRPQPNEEPAETLCMDAVYVGYAARVTTRQQNYQQNLKTRRQEADDKTNIPGHKARRRVVERTHSWLNRFHKLLVSFEKTEAGYLGLLTLAAAMICWRQTIPIYG
jgi:transposase